MKLLVIDGNSLVNRAFYGVRALTTKDGQFTNAVYGFIQILNKLLHAENPDGVAVAFDLKAPTFRHLKYPGYKAGRRPMPDELRSQIPLLKDWLRYAGYHVVEQEGFEADDILGTLSDGCVSAGDDCIIATGDRDSLQLVRDRVRVFLTTTKNGRPELTVYDPQTLMEKTGMTPEQMLELKAIMGDSSDKIPGVPGIGEKGAVQLIHDFGSLDGIYRNLDSPLIRPAVRQKLIDGKDEAYLSRFLGEICRDVPVSKNPEDYRITPGDPEKLAALMRKLELYKLMDSMGISASPATGPSEPVSPDLCSLTLCPPEKLLDADALTVIPFFEDGCAVFLEENRVCPVDFENPFFVSLMTGPAEKTVWDLKNLHRLLAGMGREETRVVCDLLLAAYLCNPEVSRYDFSYLQKAYAPPAFSLQADLPPRESERLLCAAGTAAAGKTLCRELARRGQEKLLREIELPLAVVLAEMETAGVAVDRAGIEQMSETLTRRVDTLQREIFEEVGHEFNLNSPKQLGVVLFEELHLPTKKKTKSGYSTSAEVLEELRFFSPVVEKLLTFRQLSKLKSTYCDGLLSAICGDGRIHSTFNQTETRTGRISSLEPNLQNIPVRSEEGRQFRKFFLAGPGYVLCDADYSQIELRVLAAMSGDEAMIAAFGSGYDFHTVTASQVFGLPENLITPDLRSKAKAVNFGIVYGIGAFSLSKDIGVSRKEADLYIRNYLAAYPKLSVYMDHCIEQAKKDGYVTTLFGRRRYLPELSAANRVTRAFGERVARNAPIQGTAADIIKIAMIRVFRRLKSELPQARLILQIHDELIVECPEADQAAACRILKEEMESAVQLRVPMQVEAHAGKTWFDAKG